MVKTGAAGSPAKGMSNTSAMVNTRGVCKGVRGCDGVVGKGPLAVGSKMIRLARAYTHTTYKQRSFGCVRGDEERMCCARVLLTPVTAVDRGVAWARGRGARRGDDEQIEGVGAVQIGDLHLRNG